MTTMNFNDKIILVSKRKVLENGEELFDTYFGKVQSYNENTVMILRPNGEEESLPYGEDYYQPAKEGFYELKDGTTCEDPDYIGRFVVYENEAAYEKTKEYNA